MKAKLYIRGNKDMKKKKARKLYEKLNLVISHLESERDFYLDREYSLYAQRKAEQIDSALIPIRQFKEKLYYTLLMEHLL